VAGRSRQLMGSTGVSSGTPKAGIAGLSVHVARELVAELAQELGSLACAMAGMVSH